MRRRSRSLRASGEHASGDAVRRRRCNTTHKIDREAAEPHKQHTHGKQKSPTNTQGAQRGRDARSRGRSGAPAAPSPRRRREERGGREPPPTARARGGNTEPSEQERGRRARREAGERRRRRATRSAKRRRNLKAEETPTASGTGARRRGANGCWDKQKRARGHRGIERRGARLPRPTAEETRRQRRAARGRTNLDNDVALKTPTKEERWGRGVRAPRATTSPKRWGRGVRAPRAEGVNGRRKPPTAAPRSPHKADGGGHPRQTKDPGKRGAKARGAAGKRAAKQSGGAGGEKRPRAAARTPPDARRAVRGWKLL